ARVIVAFVVEGDGSLSHIRALNQNNTSAATEAVRVIATSPKWSPGVQNGKKVRVEYTVPIDFTLTDANEQPKVAITTDTLPKRAQAKRTMFMTYQYNISKVPAGVSSVATY